MSKTITRDDVGNYFIKNGRFYKCISHCQAPTATMEDVSTGEQIGGSVLSPNLSGFEPVDKITTKAFETLIKEKNKEIKRAEGYCDEDED